MGGSSRIPLFQTILQQAVGKLSVNTNLNTDDSAALGCVYYGSGSKYSEIVLKKCMNYHLILYSQRFIVCEKMFTTSMKRITLLLIMVEFPVFPVFAGRYGYERERTFTFPASSDFRVALHYHENQIRGTLAEYHIGGIHNLVESIENRIESNVTLVYQVDEFGLIRVKKAELVSKFITQEGCE